MDIRKAKNIISSLIDKIMIDEDLEEEEMIEYLLKLGMSEQELISDFDYSVADVEDIASRL